MGNSRGCRTHRQSLILMGSMTKLWHYELLCITEVLGYVLAGPIGNQVLVARWFQVRRGRAMGYVYLGLGLGGVVSPLLSNFLIRNFGWRHALEFVGSLVMIVLIPVGIFFTRSVPADLGLLPDGATDGQGSSAIAEYGDASLRPVHIQSAVRTTNFWLILAGSTVVIGAIGAVIQHFILFLKDEGYSASGASRFFTALLVASLGGRVLVGYLADRFRKKDVMALFYGILSVSVLLLNFAHHPAVIWAFVAVFCFSVGAGYIPDPFVAPGCFVTPPLGALS